MHAGISTCCGLSKKNYNCQLLISKEPVDAVLTMAGSSNVLTWVFVFPRMFLEPLGLWPGNRTTWKQVLFFTMAVACFVEEIGHIMYLANSWRNINEIPTTAIPITTVFQVVIACF